jgi:hypothetical protein
MPNDTEPYIDNIKSKELRANKPLIYSKLELEFFDKKSKKNEIFQKYNETKIIYF